MLNFSKLFDNNQPKKNEENKTIQFSDLLNKLSKNSPETSKPDKITEPATEIKNTPKDFDKNKTVDDSAIEARAIYQQAATMAEQIFERKTSLNINDIELIILFITTIITAIKNNDMDMISYVFKYNPAEKINPYALKLINVSILSIEIGMELNYNELQLTQLGIAAFLHDIGLNKYNTIINQNRRLTPKERKDLERYHNATQEVIAPVKERLGNDIIKIIEQSSTVKTMPPAKGLQGEAIYEAVQIIAIVDTYEALTHPRPYRQKYSPMEAIKIILSDRTSFDPKFAKLLLERVGLYPRGTFVELSTKETAQVLTQNPKMPTSPIIRIIYQANGNKIENGRDINLAKETEIYITKSL